MNFEMNYHKMVSADHENEENSSPSKAEFKKKMSQSLVGNDTNSRILAFKNKAPTPREGICSISCSINSHLELACKFMII